MFFFNLKFLKQTKVRILLWINFISCILKYKNSKKILLYSQLGWHLGSQQNLRKKFIQIGLKKEILSCNSC